MRCVLTDSHGQGWLTFGSFWGGIQLIPIEWPSGKPAKLAVPTMIASRGTSTNAIEAPSLIYHDDAYYWPVVATEAEAEEMPFYIE